MSSTDGLSRENPSQAARLDEARCWWVIAMEDRRVAAACLALDPPSLGNAAYHCEQAAEKILKGLLVEAIALLGRLMSILANRT